MRKAVRTAFTAAVLVTVLTSVCACGAITGAEAPEEEEAIQQWEAIPEEPEDKGLLEIVEETLTPEQAFEASSAMFPAGLPAAEDAARWLAGSWTLLSRGGSEDLTSVSLTFSDDGGSLSIADTSRDITLTAGVTLDRCFQVWDSFNLLHLSPGEASGLDTAFYEEDFQFLAASVNGSDLLALRENGNGGSQIGDAVFGYDSICANGFWVFMRAGGPLLAPPPDPEPLRRREASFYAWEWQIGSDGVYLQEVDINTFEDDWYGEMTTALSYAPKNNSHPLTAIPYDLSAYASWKVENTGAIMPGFRLNPRLVLVTADAEGVVNDHYEVPYLGYGYYRDLALTPEYGIDVQPPETEGEGEGEGEGTEEGTGEEAPVLIRALPLEEAQAQGIAGEYVFGQVTENAEGMTVLFLPEQPVTDFAVLRLGFDGMNDDGTPRYVTEDLFWQESITPEQPAAVQMEFPGDGIPTNGIRFVDAEGQPHFYSISLSGMDGSIVLSPF